ncbi:jerky protein homolog-like [Antedon mediterranea]|uniref:jerky protein homolog-like n=1 Tax=Antedon mediterranea TaxID=105859 RepID=UPI003AF970F0
MVRNYKRGNGKRKYKSFSDDDLKQAVDAVQNGMSQAAASRTFGITRSTLQNKLDHKHKKDVGRPTVLSEAEEKILVQTLSEVAKWGYPLTPHDMKIIIQTYLNNQGREVKVFKNNIAGDEFIRSFATRNKMSLRAAGNIKRARARVSRTDVQEYFDNLSDILSTVDPAHIFKYDETNVTDDPGSKKLIVPRGTRRVERVKEHSKVATSIMVCGSASGELLPPFVVYKALNYYENWTKDGPDGTKYDATKSGWFDMATFHRWFFEVFIVHIADMEGPKLLIGDNLASHFSPEVVTAAKENNVYFTALPPNSTHLTQPLDVAVFRPMKVVWRNILDNWRKTSRRQGTIPKEVFPTLLNRLWNKVKENVASNLKGGFREAGLYPFNPQEVLKNLPGAEERDHDEIGRDLDASLVELLMENRGQDKAPKRKRGKKIRPGVQIQKENCPSTSRVGNEPGTEQTITEVYDENKCATCHIDYDTYSGTEWLQCVYCLKWVCGQCNGGEYKPEFSCDECD